MFSMSSIRSVVVRPWLWPSAIGALFAFARRGWWRRWPFLPSPDPSLIEWRVTTAYGRADMTLADDDLVSYLRWRRQAKGTTSA
ncbi:MAG: hypothetical protein QNJ71_02280 [Acidimicrobiia bacterium]|nr:hypothetical protein [Acidimicrobiia bacterium]